MPAIKTSESQIIEMGLLPVFVGLLAVSAFEIPLQRNQRVNQLLENEDLNAATTSVPLMNEVNRWYNGTIYVGSPPQPLTFTVNTLSPWTWFNDAECHDCYLSTGFDHLKSTTYTMTDEILNAFNGYGSLGYDVMTFNASETQVTSQPFLRMQGTYTLEGVVVTDGEVVSIR